MLSPKVKLLACLGLIVLSFSLALKPTSHMVMAAGTPDAYGQQIQFALVYQWTGTAWVLRANITTAAYVSGVDVDVIPAQPIKIFTCTEFNDDFNTAKSQAEALSDVRVYITIGSEVTNALLTDHNSTYKATGDWWRTWSSYLWNASGKPIAGQTYATSLRYQAYFSPDEYTP